MKLGYFKRMRVYLGEMFPVGRHLAVAAATYLAVAAFARLTHGIETSVWSLYLPLGVWSYLAVPLILRLMDELKDEDIDRALFAERPLPSGRVRRADICASLAGVIAVYLSANAFHPLTLAAAGAVVVYSLLMFKRFFAVQAHRNSLPLTLVTHNPIVPLSLSYGFFLFAAEHAFAPTDLSWGPLLTFVVMLWMPFLAWELSRKIRAPEEEDAYVTYTRLLGSKGSVAAVLLVQAVGLAAGAVLCLTLLLTPLFLFPPGVAWFATFWAGRRFLRAPNRHTSKLRPFAESFVVATIASVLIVLWRQLS